MMPLFQQKKLRVVRFGNLSVRGLDIFVVRLVTEVSDESAVRQYRDFFSRYCPGYVQRALCRPFLSESNDHVHLTSHPSTVLCGVPKDGVHLHELGAILSDLMERIINKFQWIRSRALQKESGTNFAKN